MTKTTLLLAALLAAALLPAQTEKSATPLPTQNSTINTQNSTRAVVIGISDYQDPAIPDLRFADRDAEAFANFLRSPGGGALNEDNLRLLTNQKATGGEVVSALTWLLDESMPGDQAIIYFSGHGDVEAKLLNQLGFLLLWDSPAKIYLSGALSVDMLRQVVSTLSVDKKVKVFIVVDACRAGKLAGNTVIGTQLTSIQLAQQFSQEQKVLSCQPNEFSIEGEQWDGGRGVFSYHLCNGLYGLADANHDGLVSLFEIGRYLEDRVPKEVEPLSQLPLTVGDKSSLLFSVDQPTLADLRKHGKPPTNIALVEQRGLLQDVLAKIDASVRFWHAGFERTLRDKYYFEPADDCADFFFQKLVGTESIAALHPMLRRNYAAALQDEAQQLLNVWLRDKEQRPIVINHADSASLVAQRNLSSVLKRRSRLPQLLERAADLLGEQHYMYPILQGRKHFFEGYTTVNERLSQNATRGKTALEHLNRSLFWQPNQPYVYWQMSKAYGHLLRQPDSAEYYARRAIELQPNWTLPCIDIAFLLSRDYQMFDRAKPFLELAMRIDSTSSSVWDCWGRYFYLKKQYTEAEHYFKKAIQLDPYFTTLQGYLALIYAATNRIEEAERQYQRTIQMDPTSAEAHRNLGILYRDTRRLPEAEAELTKAILLDSTNSLAHFDLGQIYSSTGRVADAECQYQKAIQADTGNTMAYYNLGVMFHTARKYAKAEQCFKKAIQLDSTHAGAFSQLGAMYFTAQLYPAAERCFKKAIQFDSTKANHFQKLGALYSTLQRYPEAEHFLDKALRMDTSNAYIFSSLGKLYDETNQFAEAERMHKKAIQLDSSNAIHYFNLGTAYLNSKRFPDADEQFAKAIQIDPGNSLFYYNYACSQAYQNRTDPAYKFLGQALNAGYNDYPWLMEDTDLAPLREQTERWKALMKKHFPDKVKD